MSDLRPVAYCAVTESGIAGALGRADYSYYFVLRRFLPILAELGPVQVESDLASVRDRVAELREAGMAPVVFLFAPPHVTPSDLDCPVIPVFAWEFDTIPDEAWGGEPRNDWATVLGQQPGAITHSEFAISAVRRSLGQDFPIAALPAPVWDEFSAIPDSVWDGSPRTLSLDGTVLDSRDLGLHDEPHFTPVPFPSGPRTVTLSGVVFTSSFNPRDERKNWWDMITAFVWAFRDEPDATLVLKLIHFDRDLVCEAVLLEMRKLAPYRCRIVVIHGYLETPAFHDLVRATTFIVNTSMGEGQCLPLMEFMSAGTPAIAPDHTAMADYIDSSNAFVCHSSPEPTNWPHDPRLVLRCHRERLDWESIESAFVNAFALASTDADGYREMAEAARQRLRWHCSTEVIRARFHTQVPSMLRVGAAPGGAPPQPEA